MKIILLSSFFFFVTFSVQSQTVKISSYGLKDVNKSFEMAMSSSNDTIVIGALHSPWYVKPLLFKNIADKVIVIEKEVEIIARQGAFPDTNNSLITFINCKNITIIGNGAKLCMQKKEYETGEWRHGISLRGAKNIVIENLSISDTGGDGVYVAGSKRLGFSENIILKSIRSMNNKRQGLSIISAKKVKISDSYFSKTTGTLPGAGIDIEPNNPNDVIEDILISNCISEDNFGAGLVIGLGRLNALSNPVSITLVNCVIRKNHSKENPSAAAEIIIGANSKKPVGGKVIFKDCQISDSNWGMLYSRKLAEAFSVEFIDCYVKNIGGNGTSPVVYLEVPNYYKNLGSVGGFVFNDLYFENNNGVKFLTIRGSKIGTLTEVKDISANIISPIVFEDSVEYINYFSYLNENVNLNFEQRKVTTKN